MMENLLRFNKKMRYAYFDVETECLCLHIPLNLPWQLGMLKVTGDTTTDSYCEYIKWDRPLKLSAKAAEITRYDAAKVEKYAKPYREVIEKAVDWTSNCDYICGSNVLGFDIYFLIYFYELCGKSSKGLAEKVLDTHLLAKGLKINNVYNPSKNSLLEYQYTIQNTKAKGVKTKLEVLGREYGIEHDYESCHDALSDLVLNKKVFDKLVYQIEI